MTAGRLAGDARELRGDCRRGSHIRRGLYGAERRARTFGALNIPGTELCTMLIIHCLDNIGFNRAAIGLGGFVSPNQIARVFNAPKGKSAF
jgi:hypothetical protein